MNDEMATFNKIMHETWHIFLAYTGSIDINKDTIKVNISKLITAYDIAVKNKLIVAKLDNAILQALAKQPEELNKIINKINEIIQNARKYTSKNIEEDRHFFNTTINKIKTALMTLDAPITSLNDYLPILLESYNAAATHKLITSAIHPVHLKSLPKIPTRMRETKIEAMDFLNTALSRNS